MPGVPDEAGTAKGGPDVIPYCRQNNHLNHAQKHLFMSNRCLFCAHLYMSVFYVCLYRSGSWGPFGVSDSWRRAECNLYCVGESAWGASCTCGCVRRQRPSIRYHFIRSQVLWGGWVRKILMMIQWLLMNFKGAVLQVLFSEVNSLHNRRKSTFLLIGYCAVEKNNDIKGPWTLNLFGLTVSKSSFSWSPLLFSGAGWLMKVLETSF